MELEYLCSAKLLQSCLTLFEPMHHSPPGSSVHGILLCPRARILEWVLPYLEEVKCELIKQPSQTP